VQLARGTGPYMCSIFSKCTSRVVVVRLFDRCLAGEAGDPAGKIHWARTRPSVMQKGNAARDFGIRCGPNLLR